MIRLQNSKLLTLFLAIILLCCSFSWAISSPRASTSDKIICSPTDSSDCYPLIFKPTDEFEIVKPGQHVPPGLHIRMDYETGLKWAKLVQPDESSPNSIKNVIIKDSINGHSQSKSVEHPHTDLVAISSSEKEYKSSSSEDSSKNAQKNGFWDSSKPHFDSQIHHPEKDQYQLILHPTERSHSHSLDDAVDSLHSFSAQSSSENSPAYSLSTSHDIITRLDDLSEFLLDRENVFWFSKNPRNWDLLLRLLSMEISGESNIQDQQRVMQSIRLKAATLMVDCVQVSLERFLCGSSRLLTITK
ncbi:hypothetical protein BKA69DRAFT_412472 [Paraphysoderma sedebokerense]|nr:hypothetical protein BKA69DRAFT_412472 [Paraphysoderma sedebokerense]